jgi:hypothetical protein
MNSFTNLVPIPNPDKPGNPNLWGLEMETETGERKKENQWGLGVRDGDGD